MFFGLKFFFFNFKQLNQPLNQTLIHPLNQTKTNDRNNSNLSILSIPLILSINTDSNQYSKILDLNQIFLLN